MKRHHLKECHPYLHFKSDGQCVYEMVLLFTLNTLDSFLYLLKSMSCIFCRFKDSLSHICLDLTAKYRKEFKIIIDCVLLYNSFCVTVHSLFDHLGVQWHALAFTVCCSVDCLFFCVLLSAGCEESVRFASSSDDRPESERERDTDREQRDTFDLLVTVCSSSVA